MLVPFNDPKYPGWKSYKDFDRSKYNNHELHFLLLIENDLKEWCILQVNMFEGFTYPAFKGGCIDIKDSLEWINFDTCFAKNPNLDHLGEVYWRDIENAPMRGVKQGSIWK